MKRTKPPMKRKSTKGQNLTSDFIPYAIAQEKGNELLWHSKHPVVGFYIIFSINTGLRISDIRRIKHSDLITLQPGDDLRVQERKTGKYRDIQINHKVMDAYHELRKRIPGVQPDSFIFVSQKGTVYQTPSLILILKKEFYGIAPRISTHSLRKSFGRHVYELNGNSEDALIKLSEMFQHSGMAMTRKYLGLRKEELKDIYMNL